MEKKYLKLLKYNQNLQ